MSQKYNNKSATLGEICDRTGGVVQTGPFGSQLHQSDYKLEGVPVVMPQDIVDDRISDSKISRIDENLANRLQRHLLSEGDIVFPRRGEIKKRAIVEESQQGYFCGTGCLKISLPIVELIPRWLYYYLGQEHIAQWIENKAVGSTMLNLNTGILRSLPIEYPSLTQQRDIVRLLHCYDDLIETNRRRIALLEESARLLYREWFVNLRFPGHEQVKIVNGLPEGWKQKRLSDVVDVNPSTPFEKDRFYPFVPMQSLSESSMLIGEKEERVISGGAKFQNNDTLLARITPCLENGKTGFVQFLDESRPVASGSTEFIVMRSKTVNPYWVYCLAREESFREHAIRSMAGADGRQRVNVKCFDTYLVLEPPASVLKEFENIAADLFLQVEVLSSQNESLQQSRDSLLPKLMSGELSV